MRSDARPKCASVPRPPSAPSPSTPKPCASSTTSHASNSSASASELRQRREVAVHAEHGVGRDQLPPRRRRREAPPQRGDVAMRIADEIRARKQRAVVEARVVEPVGEDRIAAPGERGQDREVGEIARRERQRPRVGAGSHERRELRSRAPRAARSGRRSGATRRRPRPSACAVARPPRRRPDDSRARDSRCSRTPESRDRRR